VRAGSCRIHWKRWRSTGSLEPTPPGENNRRKTHCPQGHEYTRENTYVFADGRRRCRWCRIDGVLRSRRKVPQNVG
jgi:hypothetical protein